MTGKDLLIRVGQIVVPPGRFGSNDLGFNLNSPFFLDTYSQIYAYLMNQRASTGLNLVPEKGITLCGGIGAGKTVCMKVIQQMALRVNQLQKREMCIVSVGDFLKAFKENENDAFSTYGYAKKMELCVDELGWEAMQKHHYGNDTSAIIANLIMERYRLFIETGIRTHFTTNHKVKDEPNMIGLMGLYGARVVDRLNEMTNLINWMGGSLRK